MPPAMWECIPSLVGAQTPFVGLVDHFPGVSQTPLNMNLELGLLSVTVDLQWTGVGGYLDGRCSMKEESKGPQYMCPRRQAAVR